MTKSEIRALLATILPAETTELDPPSAEDWRALQERIGTQFPQEFMSFVDLMSEFAFPGDIFNVRSSGTANGNDSIETVLEHDRPYAEWPANLVPFYGLGTGDYFALDATEGVNSAVYFRDHEDNSVTKDSTSFEMWLRGLPAFLR